MKWNLIWKPWPQVEAEDVLEKESSVHERILSPIAASKASAAIVTAPTQQQRRGIGGVAPFGRQFSMARMAARIRRPRRCAQSCQTSSKSGVIRGILAQ